MLKNGLYQPLFYIEQGAPLEEQGGIVSRVDPSLLISSVLSVAELYSPMWSETAVLHIVTLKDTMFTATASLENTCMMDHKNNLKQFCF